MRFKTKERKIITINSEEIDRDIELQKKIKVDDNIENQKRIEAKVDALSDQINKK